MKLILNRLISQGIAVAAAVTLLLGPVFAFGQTVQRIVAVVNDDVISGYDLEQRTRLVISSQGNQPKAAMLEKMKAQILNTLINERLTIQEAQRIWIVITKKEIESGIEAIEKTNRMPRGALTKLLERQNVDIQTMREQVRAGIAWQKLVITQVRPKIIVQEDDVEAAVKRKQQSAQLNQEDALVELKQIYIPVKKNAKAGEIEKQIALARDMTSSINGCKDFIGLAKKMGSPESGSLGQVKVKDTPPIFQSTLRTLEIGVPSKPMRSEKGLHVLMICDRIQAKIKADRKNVRMALGQARLDKMADRYLQDLRRNAIIDLR